MAGANETPRNKLIALMYLVFITMLALNVSKEVLDGFGQMFKKIQSANERVNQVTTFTIRKLRLMLKKKKEMDWSRPNSKRNSKRIDRILSIVFRDKKHNGRSYCR